MAYVDDYVDAITWNMVCPLAAGPVEDIPAGDGEDGLRDALVPPDAPTIRPREVKGPQEPPGTSIP